MVQASAEKFEHIGPAEKERVVSVPQREQLAITPEPPLQKGKEQNRFCTNQQPPQCDAVPDPVWVGLKWLLAFPKVQVTLGTPLQRLFEMDVK